MLPHKLPRRFYGGDGKQWKNCRLPPGEFTNPLSWIRSRVSALKSFRVVRWCVRWKLRALVGGSMGYSSRAVGAILQTLGVSGGKNTKRIHLLTPFSLEMDLRFPTAWEYIRNLLWHLHLCAKKGLWMNWGGFFFLFSIFSPIESCPDVLAPIFLYQ